MLQVYLDPYVLACPKAENGLGGIEMYVENIISWTELREAKWLQVCISNTTPQLLADTNSFPPWDALKDTLNRLQIIDIQAQDVITLVNALLGKLPYIEDSLGIKALL